MYTEAGNPIKRLPQSFGQKDGSRNGKSGQHGKENMGLVRRAKDNSKLLRQVSIYRNKGLWRRSW